MTVGNVLLSGVVGSTAYGLAGPDSDVDRLGVFAAPTVQLHGLKRPRESVVTIGPDSTMHEAGKFAILALGGNPTVTELMWLDSYETRTPLGDDLVRIRTAFLSAPRVRDAYLGYASQQFRRLEARGDGSFSADTRKRTAKHARHLARLVHQGRELYATGRVRIRLEDPQWFLDFGERVAGGDIEAARKLLATAEHDFDQIRTPVPDRPDESPVNEWLLRVRQAHLAAPPRTARRAVLVDVDGTLALRTGDRHFAHWHRVGEDDPNPPVVELVRTIASAGEHRIIVMSGRDEVCRPETEAWLRQHGVPFDELHMRPHQDNRKDSMVKAELYAKHVEGRYEVAFILDDRDQVVAQWRSMGLTCMQVAPGAF
jgi:hypothetical protein